jgi:hypothetical protein
MSVKCGARFTPHLEEPIIRLRSGGSRRQRALPLASLFTLLDIQDK